MKVLNYVAICYSKIADNFVHAKLEGPWSTVCTDWARTRLPTCMRDSVTGIQGDMAVLEVFH